MIYLAGFAFGNPIIKFLLTKTLKIMPAQVTITQEQKVKVTLNPVTSTGGPATLDGEPEWSVESGDCTVKPEPGGLSAYIHPGETIGASVVKVAADADLGAGVRTLEDLINVDVTNAEAAALGLTVGAPEPGDVINPLPASGKAKKK
jgi:hypothetical protein